MRGLHFSVAFALSLDDFVIYNNKQILPLKILLMDWMQESSVLMGEMGRGHGDQSGLFCFLNHFVK